MPKQSKSGSQREILRKVLRYIHRYIGLVIFSIILAAFICAFTLYLPILQDGTTGAWRFCLYWDNGLWGYLYGCGMYALLTETCKPEELWNDYIKEGETYAGLQMASLVMGPDNYKNVLGFYDNLIGDNYFGYQDEWDGTEYPVLYTGD